MRDIVEVREIERIGRVNDLLERGYQLLAIEGVARGVDRPRREGDDGLAARFFVAKGVVYVIGRTAEQRPIIDVLTEWNEQARLRRERDQAERAERAEREAVPAGVSA